MIPNHLLDLLNQRLILLNQLLLPMSASITPNQRLYLANIRLRTNSLWGLRISRPQPDSRSFGGSAGNFLVPPMKFGVRGDLALGRAICHPLGIWR